MATTEPLPPGAPSTPRSAISPDAAAKRPGEIKLISRSMLFYWWPVWVICFFNAAWTFLEDNRLAVLPGGGKVEVQKDATAPTEFKVTYPGETWKGRDYQEQPVRNAALQSEAGNEPWPTKVSRHPLLGVMFVLTLLLVIFTTNVPLRGLWSFVVALMVALVIVIISLVPGAWDKIFNLFSRFLVFINMGAYLFIGGVVFVLWAVAFFIFDRRQFVIFSPGQIRVCEHIGDSVEAYSTVGVQLTKQRDDPFRHLLLGFGSSDLIIKFATGDRREVRIQNVLGLNFNMAAVEDMIRTVPS